MNMKNVDILRKKQFGTRSISALFEGELKKKLGIVRFTELISDFVTLHCSTNCLFIMCAPSASAVLQYTIVESLF